MARFGVVAPPVRDRLGDRIGRHVLGHDRAHAVAAAVQVAQLDDGRRREGGEVRREPVAPRQRHVEASEGDRLRHVLRANHLHLDALDGRARAARGLPFIVALERESGGGERLDRVALRVPVGHREAQRAVAAVVAVRARLGGAAVEHERRRAQRAVAHAVGGRRVGGQREQRVERLAQVALAERAPVRDEPRGAAVHLGDHLQPLAFEERGRAVARRDGEHGGVGVLGRPRLRLAPHLDQPVVGRAQPVEVARGEVRVRRRDAQRAALGQFGQRRAPRRGEHDARLADVERAQRHDRVVPVARHQLVDRGAARDAEVVLAERDLDRDVLVGEDAHRDARAALDAEAVRARPLAVPVRREADRRQPLGERRAQVAPRQRDADRVAAHESPPASAISTSTSAPKPEAATARPPMVSASPS